MCLQFSWVQLMFAAFHLIMINICNRVQNMICTWTKSRCTLICSSTTQISRVNKIIFTTVFYHFRCNHLWFGPRSTWSDACRSTKQCNWDILLDRFRWLECTKLSIRRKWTRGNLTVCSNVKPKINTTVIHRNRTWNTNKCKTIECRRRRRG